MAFFPISRTMNGAPGGREGIGWPRIILFVSIALACCLGLSWIVGYFEYSDSTNFLIALAAIFLVPAGLILAWAGVPQGWRAWKKIWPHLHWYHLLWTLMFVSDFVWSPHTAQQTEADPLSPSTWGRIGPELVIGFVLLFGMARKKIDWPKSVFDGPLFKSIAVFCAVGFISTYWSVYKPFSAYKSIEFFEDAIILACVIMNCVDVDDFEIFWDFAWILTGINLFWVWCNMIFWPSEALQPVPESGDPVPRLQGVYPVTGYNAVGVAGAIIALIALTRLFPYKREKPRNVYWYIGMFLFGTGSLFLSQTRSAMVGFGLAVILVLLVAGRFYLLVGGAALSLATLLLTPLGPIAWDYVSRSQSAAELESLSGRTDWWAFGYQVWQKHPYTGVGMYAAGKFAVMQQIGKGDTATMHSDWLEIFVGTSVWGVFPVVFLVLACWWFLSKYIRKREFSIAERQLAMEALGILLILSVRSFFNVELVWHSPSNFFPVVGYAEYMRRRWRSMQLERNSNLAGFTAANGVNSFRAA